MRSGRRLLHHSTLHRPLQCKQRSWNNCHVSSRWQSTQEDEARPHNDPVEFQKNFACNNPRFPFNLSGANNLNLNDTDSWPIPDVFPRPGEDTPLEQFAEGPAIRRAYLNPPVGFLQLRDLFYSSDEFKRKIGWKEQYPWNLDIGRGGPGESALYLRLSPEYLKISRGNQKPSNAEWLGFVLRTADAIHGEGSNLLDEIRAKQLLGPVKLATISFLEALSSSNYLENTRTMVSAKFRNYLWSQYRIAKPYRPIFHVDADSIKVFPPKSPYLLLGHPRVYEARDRYFFRKPMTNADELGVEKVQVPPPENHPLKYIYVSKYENVAVARGLFFPMPVPFTLFGMARNAWEHSVQWFKDAEKRSVIELFGLKLLDYVDMGSESGLGFIVDIPMEAMMGIDIVDGDGNVVSGQAKELRNFIVTLRSKQLSPGWKVNSESVRWYIEDINLTTRRIKWSEPQRQFWPTPKDS